MTTGLILGGGGARAAYQVGVLKAVAELIPANSGNPFPIICGASAGAINAAVLATYASRFDEGVNHMIGLWENIVVESVYKTDVRSAISSGAHWISALLFGGYGWFSPPRSLLNNSPLRKLIERHVSEARILQAIEHGDLQAMGITACSYSTGYSVSFYQGKRDIEPWIRSNRLGVATKIAIDHLMASAAIPMLFPPIKIDKEYYGDGSMRQTAPISPALHLGANKVLVIGVRRDSKFRASLDDAPKEYPSFGHVGGFILDTLFLDNLSADLERLYRINETLEYIPKRRFFLRHEHPDLKPVDCFIVSPTEDLATIAQQYYKEFPSTVRYLLHVVGAGGDNGRRIMSYLLFSKSHCKALIEAGYQSTMALKDELLDFLTSD